ncbi:MAG: response regulator, partial [Proteobacteria bacterium]|nr:response regulator [Pseudomonadota bacterium]
KYGHSPATAFGFAGYGMMLSGVLERFEAGCRFGELALSVGERPSARNSRSKTWFLVETTIRHWKNPLRETLKPLLQAYRFGLETGDIEYALFSAHTHCVYSLFAGEPLPEIADKMSDFRRIMIQFDQKTTLNIFEIYRQTILNLTEQSEDPCRFDGDAYREDEMLPIHRGANDNTALFLMYFNKLTLCYLFGRHKQAVGHAETAEKYLESVTGSYQVPLYYFYDSLARLGALSGTGKAERRRYLKKIARDRKKMRKWARHAPMNFQHKYYLMEAERSRVLGRNQQALDCYDRAIASAGENEYLQEEALANELAAGFWLEKDKGEVAAVYLQKAHYFYGLWGANRKVEYLEERHPFLSASRELATNGTTRHTIQSPGTATTKMSTVSGALDTKTIMKVSQSLTKEVHLEKLLENIIRLVMENAGATKGILMTDEDGSLRVRVKGEAAGETIDTMHAMPVEDYDDIPLSIVNYTARTQTPVVLNDAPRNATYGTDTYIRTRQPKSVLCMPIVHLAKLRGILYLENDLATGAFTPDSLELLKILSSQAAISMENTHYYKSLEESEKKFRSLYERAVEGIFQTSVNGNLIGVNPALVRILGYDSEEDLLAGIADFTRQPFVTADDREEFGNLLLEKGQAVGFETQMYRKDQSVIWISLSAQFVEDDSGKAPHYEGLLLDVTERKQREEAERLRKVAEAATRSKSDFLANMSHEIRTPLNAILGMAELLSETELSIEQKDYVRTFQSSGEQLLSIINDILDFSKIEAGQIELESIPFDLTELAENVCKILAVQAHAKGLELACRIAPQVHTFRLGDPTHLRQILTNLIGNAVKFTRKGEVVLEVVPEQDTAVPDRLRFCVRDTGIGIPLERRETLFEGFSQADTSTSRKFGGTGLGLTISKRLVGLMGGKIWIESEVGQGSRFIFNAELPRTDPLPTSTFAPPNDLEGLKILVVDANATNRLVLRERLLDWGAHVEEVKSGEEALDQLKLSENQGATYGLVLLDFNIPGLDGFQVAEQVDLLPLTDPPPIIMLTSSEGIGNRILAGKLKLAGYLVKPVKREDLLESIRTALGGKETVSKPTPPVETVVLPPMRILLAEDIEANWKIIKLFLKETPVTIDIAENGRIAVEKYRAEKHDLVLMDIQMPEMDGYEATRRIRSWEDETGVAPVPIIALTAHAFKQRQQESYEAGCDDFLTKPVKKKKLLEKIGALHQVKTESEALGASTDDRLALPEEISSHVVSPQTPAKKSRPKVRIDAFLKELIPDFLQDANQELKNMRSALENSDFETLNRLGHGFKGASGNYELDDLAEIFLAMEKAAAAQDPETAGRNLKKAAEYLEQVEIEFTEE